MRTVETRPPSFPDVAMNKLLETVAGERWQVVCGDAGHWRVGIYSPGESRQADIAELEKHDIPEFFLLLSGRMSLLLSENGKLRELALDIGKPTLISAPHCGFCPDGPHTGTALVVERDAFGTEYRKPQEW